MKLRITFGADGQQSIEHPWNDNETFETNMRQAVIKAVDAGMSLQELRDSTAKIRAIKEREGECCPCCGTPLI